MDDDERLTISVPTAGNDTEGYAPGDSDEIIVTFDDVPPVIGLSQDNSLTAEGDTDIYTFAIGRQRATPTQIRFRISGNDLTDDEIIILPETGTTPIPGCVANAPCVISLPENEDSVVVRLSARIDARLENTETWTLQLLTNPGEHYTVAPSANRIVSDITNTRFEAGFREAAAFGSGGNELYRQYHGGYRFVGG